MLPGDSIMKSNGFGNAIGTEVSEVGFSNLKNTGQNYNIATNPLLSMVNNKQIGISHLTTISQDINTSNLTKKVTIQNREKFQKIDEPREEAENDREVKDLIEKSERVRLINPKKREWEKKFQDYKSNKKYILKSFCNVIIYSFKPDNRLF